jgi:hypothetical protein
MTDNNEEEELLVNWPHRGADSVPRRDTLLEHWPKRKSSMTIASFDSGEADAAASASHKRYCVDFSESSRLHTYQGAPISLLRSLTYTKDNRDAFDRDAFLEGIRIKNLIANAPLDSASESIKYLLRHDIISSDELIGIEHFILGKPTRVHKIRKHHAAAVLWKQQEQQEQKLEDPVVDLGKFAESSSLRSTQRARIRAAMAA